MDDKFESKFSNFQGKYRNRSVTKSVIFIKAKGKQLVKNTIVSCIDRYQMDSLMLFPVKNKLEIISSIGIANINIGSSIYIQKLILNLCAKV